MLYQLSYSRVREITEMVTMITLCRPAHSKKSVHKGADVVASSAAGVFDAASCFIATSSRS